MQTDVLVIGGGLAGLTAATLLARSGRRVLLLEKKAYPYHKVCGEYISNEALGFLRSIGLDPFQLGAVPISRLQVSSPRGVVLETPLGLGGFGISRYVLDEAYAQLAVQASVVLQTETRVTAVAQTPDGYSVTTDDGHTHHAALVVGSWGKRETLDKQLNRPFMQARTGWLAVKYHVRVDHPNDLIALHNFTDGYCGISRVEDGRYCLCYLTRRSNLQAHGGSIAEMQQQVLARNPHLRRIFDSAEQLYDKPEVINEISFAQKEAVVQGVWCVGDAAGLITPLCGNGMAMAIRGGKLVADLVIGSGYYTTHSQPTAAQHTALAQQYTQAWRGLFATRLAAGRALQALFGQPQATELAIGLLGRSPRLLQALIRQTHGLPF